MNSTAYLKTNAYNKCCTSKLKITKNLTKKAIRFIRRCLWAGKILVKEEVFQNV